MKEKFKTLVISALEGKLLFRLVADKYLPHIVFFFALSIVFIWANIKFEEAAHEMEENKTVLVNLKGLYTDKRCVLTELESISKVEELLSEMGSNLKFPEKPAKRIE